MKIERIEITGFGKLRTLTKEKDLELAPGINVFFGRNGAGKSTLQQAILALFYGFYVYEGSRAKDEETRTWERFRPWQGGSYGGALEYTLDNGERFRVERNFGLDDIPTRILDLATGQDITRSFGIGRRGNVPFARKHIGMPRSVFISTAFISQGATKKFEGPKQVGDTIVSLADTGKRDISAAKAVERLGNAIKEDVGTDKSRTTPLPVALRKLEEARQKLNEYREAKQGILDDAKKREKLLEELDQIKLELQKIDFSIVSKQLERVGNQLQRIKAQDQAIAEAKEQLDKFRRYAKFPKDFREKVVEERGSLNDAYKHRAALQEAINKKKTELGEANTLGEYEVLRKTMEQLSHSEFEGLKEMQQQLNKLSQDIGEKKQSLAALESRRIPMKPWMIVLAVLLPPIGIPLLLWYRRKLKKSIEKEKSEIREALASLEENQRDVATLQKSILDKYEVIGLDELIEKRLRYSNLRSSIAQYTGLQDQINQVILRIREAQEKLLTIFRQAGIDEKDYDKASTLFDEGYDGKLKYDDAEQALNFAKSQRSQILGTQPLQEVEEQQKRLSNQIEAMLANNSQLTGLLKDRTLEELEKDRKTLNAGREGLNEKIAGLTGRIGKALEGHRDGAEIEEDLAQYQEEVEELKLYRDFLQLARREIEAAASEVHRDFAPRLAQAVGDKVARITGGYYRDIYIDPPTLSVTIREPAIDRLLPAETPGFGTEEQIYLLLRMELARLMSNLHERIPLLLDSPFAYSDPLRLQRVLNVILDLSKENQILLFTENLNIVRWVRFSLAKDTANRFFVVHTSGLIMPKKLPP